MRHWRSIETAERAMDPKFATITTMSQSSDSTNMTDSKDAASTARLTTAAVLACVGVVATVGAAFFIERPLSIRPQVWAFARLSAVALALVHFGHCLLLLHAWRRRQREQESAES